MLSIFEKLLLLRFSLLTVPYHADPLLNKYKMFPLLCLVLVICESGNLMVLGGFIPIFPSALRPRSTLLLLPLLRILKGKSQSLCPYISMKALAWLDSTMRLSSNRALPIASSFEYIVVVKNKRCSILVQLVSSDRYIVEVGILLALFLKNGVVSYGVGILLI